MGRRTLRREGGLVRVRSIRQWCRAPRGSYLFLRPISAIPASESGPYPAGCLERGRGALVVSVLVWDGHVLCPQRDSMRFAFGKPPASAVRRPAPSIASPPGSLAMVAPSRVRIPLGALWVLGRVANPNVLRKIHALYLRWLRLESGQLTGGRQGVLEDARGACRASVETVQTFLAPGQSAALVEEFAAGATAKSLAQKYGVSVRTVRAHARRVGAVLAEAIPDDVLADYAHGVPVSVLAERCGVSPDSIERLARLAGVMPGPRLVTPEEATQIADWYTGGVSLAQIGKRTGLRPVRVRDILVEAGVTVRRRGRPSLVAGREKEIMGLRAQGWSYVRIGARVGVDASTIKKFLSHEYDL